ILGRVPAAPGANGGVRPPSLTRTSRDEAIRGSLPVTPSMIGFSRWFGQPEGRASRRQRARRWRAQFVRQRPSLEGLEDRAMLAANLAITPISWNVVGLDSNNVNTGPNQFLIGARVTNTGDATATHVAVNYNWDGANALINLQGQPLQTVTALAPGASADFYY